MGTVMGVQRAQSLRGCISSAARDHSARLPEVRPAIVRAQTTSAPLGEDLLSDTRQRPRTEIGYRRDLDGFIETCNDPEHSALQPSLQVVEDGREAHAVPLDPLRADK